MKFLKKLFKSKNELPPPPPPPLPVLDKNIQLLNSIAESVTKRMEFLREKERLKDGTEFKKS